jgi:hypothetical protein
MANTGMAHFGLNPANFIQWLGVEFTGQYHEVQATLAAVQGLISPDDYAHIEQILLECFPAQQYYEEPLSKN